MSDPERCPDCGGELPQHRTADDVTFTVQCPCRITPEIREAIRKARQAMLDNMPPESSEELDRELARLIRQRTLH